MIPTPSANSVRLLSAMSRYNAYLPECCSSLPFSIVLTLQQTKAADQCAVDTLLSQYFRCCCHIA